MEGITQLSHITDVRKSNWISQKWFNALDLGIPGRWSKVWHHFIGALEEANIEITLQEYEIIWASTPHGRYTPRDGCTTLLNTLDPVDMSWWWRTLWKLKSPHKTCLFMWCILSNKVPMEVNLMRRAFHGPSRCCFCKENAKDIDHMFLHCPMVGQVWLQIIASLNIVLRWDGPHLFGAWKSWWNAAATQKIINLPLIVCWGIWLTKNHIIF